jgi:hypothetical protein
VNGFLSFLLFITENTWRLGIYGFAHCQASHGVWAHDRQRGLM